MAGMRQATAIDGNMRITLKAREPNGAPERLARLAKLINEAANSGPDAPPRYASIEHSVCANRSDLESERRRSAGTKLSSCAPAAPLERDDPALAIGVVIAELTIDLNLSLSERFHQRVDARLICWRTSIQGLGRPLEQRAGAGSRESGFSVRKLLEKIRTLQ